MKLITLAVLVTAMFASPTLAQEARKPLVDWRGMTLYYSTQDTGGTSHCGTGCASSWPPLYAAANATVSGDWNVTTRQDGYKQWTYQGKPLYTSTRDHKPGETNGDGVDGVWRAARP